MMPSAREIIQCQYGVKTETSKSSISGENNIIRFTYIISGEQNFKKLGI